MKLTFLDKIEHKTKGSTDICITWIERENWEKWTWHGRPSIPANWCLKCPQAPQVKSAALTNLVLHVRTQNSKGHQRCDSHFVSRDSKGIFNARLNWCSVAMQCFYHEHLHHSHHHHHYHSCHKDKFLKQINCLWCAICSYFTFCWTQKCKHNLVFC